MPTSACILTPDLQIVAVNENFLIMTSKQRAEVIGYNVCEVWPESPAGAEALRISVAAVMHSKKPHRMPITRWDGQFDQSGDFEHYWQVLNSPVFNEYGEVDCILQTSENVTDTVLAKKAASETARRIDVKIEELQVSEKNLETARALESAAKQDLCDFIMQAPMPMCIIMGSDFHYTLANPAHDRLVNRKAMGKFLADVFTETERLYHFPILKRVLETGEPYVGNELPLPLIDDDGSLKEHYTNLSFTPLRDADGKIRGILGLAHDVTEMVVARRKLETLTADLKAAVEAAESANEAKSAFLANMSHELRTPMTAILGFTEVLRDRGVTEEDKHDALQRIDSGGRALLRLIDDILDISRIEAGKLTLEKSVFAPFEVVSEAAAVVRHAAEQKGIELRLEFDPDVPLSACSDPARIRQILTNVLGNAVKFTSSGEVRIRARLDKPLHLIFDITDTGIGISQENQGRLFQRFAQADASIARQFGGSGLGLMLSRRLCEELGGNLVLVDSKLNKGSTFRVRIEAAPFDLESSHLKQASPQRLPAMDEQEQSLTGMRILVAEDTYSNQVLMHRFLSVAGADVDLASNGEEAMEKAQTELYDVILMDIQMPKMDGIQATKALRLNGYRGPILAITAHAMKEEIERSFDAGYNDHLTKPINAKTLVEAVSIYRSRTAPFNYRGQESHRI